MSSLYFQDSNDCYHHYSYNHCFCHYVSFIDYIDGHCIYVYHFYVIYHQSKYESDTVEHFFTSADYLVNANCAVFYDYRAYTS